MNTKGLPQDAVELMQALRACLGERFDDYLVLARKRSHTGTSGTQEDFYYSMSDPTWAMGACRRFRKIMDRKMYPPIIRSPEEPE